LTNRHLRYAFIAPKDRVAVFQDRQRVAIGLPAAIGVVGECPSPSFLHLYPVSLLSEPRRTLHGAVADQIERRSGNRLSEVVEVLAYHYEHTEHVNKAFTYLALAGKKSLGVYSLDEAEGHLEKALALMEANPSCTDDVGFADLVADLTSVLVWKLLPAMPLGVAMVLQGEMAAGVRFLEDLIDRNRELGFVVGRDITRLYLAELYIEILGSTQRPTFPVILRNLWFLSVTRLSGWGKALALVLAARDNAMFSEASHWRARTEADLGLLYLMKRRYFQAEECLQRARPLAAKLEASALLAKIDAGLAKLPKSAISSR